MPPYAVFNPSFPLTLKLKLDPNVSRDFISLIKLVLDIMVRIFN